MAERLFLDERELEQIGFSRVNIRTFRKLTEFVDAQTRLGEAETAIDGKQPFSNDLAAIDAGTFQGFLTRTGFETWENRTLTTTVGHLDITNPDGSAGDPILDLADTAVTPGSYKFAAITVDQQGRLTAADHGVESFVLAASDETTAITTGTAKVTFRMPYAFTVTGVSASVTTAPTGANLIIDINDGGTTILSTKLSIDAGEKTSATAATPAVISDTALAADAEITIDFDQVGSTIAGAGVKVTIKGHQ